jgi:hypothetical protein
MHTSAASLQMVKRWMRISKTSLVALFGSLQSAISSCSSWTLYHWSEGSERENLSLRSPQIESISSYRLRYDLKLVQSKSSTRHRCCTLSFAEEMSSSILCNQPHHHAPNNTIGRTIKCSTIVHLVSLYSSIQFKPNSLPQGWDSNVYSRSPRRSGNPIYVKRPRSTCSLLIHHSSSRTEDIRYVTLARAFCQLCSRT